MRFSRHTPARRRGRLHPLVIAAIVLLATAVVTFYAFNQGLPFVHRFTLYALVNNSVNVRSGSPVRIAGIDVGAVSGVSGVGDASKIQFTVSPSGLPIHKDATVRIRDRLFLEGSYYLQLDPGTPNAPVLHDGDTIPMSQTSSPVQFYQVLSTFDVATRTNLTNLLANLDQGFSAPAGAPPSTGGAGQLKLAVPQLQPVLKDVSWVSQSLRGTQPGDVGTLLNSSASVIGTLAANSSQLTDLISGLDATSTALASTDGSLAQSIAGLDKTLQTAPSALTSIDQALPPVSQLALALDPSLRAAPPILDGLTATVNQLAAALSPLERGPLLASLKATFEQFPSILSQLATSFPITKQVSDCLRTHVIPILKRTVPDGPLSSGLPVWQDFVHFLPGVGGASGSFDANGPYTRTLAGAGSNTVTGGVLGTLPVIGPIIGSSPPGNTSLLGARPTWIGELNSSDFRPDVPCATQRLPSLHAPAAASDQRSGQ